jgi:hypothetical protein
LQSSGFYFLVNLDDINETARADLLYIMENLEDVREWREKEDKLELNNPSSVRRAYDKHLRDEVAIKIKADKEAAKAKAEAEPEVEYEEEENEPSEEGPNPYVAARDEVSEGDERTYKELFEVASAELKQKDARIKELEFRTDFDEFDASTPFSEQLRLRLMGLMALITDDSRFPDLSERKRKQREAVIKQMGEFQRVLLILLEAEAVRPETTRQS